MALRFLSKGFIKKHEFDFMKKSRRQIITNKIINHNNNYLELIKFQKPISVIPESDEILDLLEKYIAPSVDGKYDALDFFDEQCNPKIYNFDLLPRKLKTFVRQIDKEIFEKQFFRVMKPFDNMDYDDKLDKLIKMIPDYTDGDFEKYVLMGKNIPSTLGRKAKESARRAYREVNHLFKSNINKFTQFVTLTFAPESNKQKHLDNNKERFEHEVNLEFDYVQVDDFEIVKKKFTRQIAYLGKTIRDMGYEFEYIAVWEIQKNGAYHFHLLTTTIPNTEQFKNPHWLDYDHITRKFKNGYGLSKWNYGKSDVQKITSPSKMTSYISKYILKSFYNVTDQNYEKYKGQRKYFPSSGLVRSEKKYVYDENVENELKIFDLGDIVPYESQFINSYNSALITNKVYTLLDKKNTAVSLAENTTAAKQ